MKPSILTGRYFKTALLAVLIPAMGFFAAGCASKGTRVVLMPDHDDHVGKVQIANAQGTATLDQAGYGVTVTQEKAPGAPEPVPEEEIQDIFAPVLHIEPALPEKFILQFKSGSDILTDESLARIPEIIAEIEKRDSKSISVDGHSDRVGDEQSNIALSLKRAEKVTWLLVDQGVDQQLVRTSSHGEGNPLVPTPDDVPEPRNRRVEVIVR